MTQTKSNKMIKKSSIFSIFIALAMIFTLANFSAVTAQQTVEDQFWNAVKDSKYIEDFDTYLKEYPKGKYAVLAGLRKRQISRGQTNNPPSTPDQMNYLITDNSVGEIKLGMTVSEARKAMKSAKFARYIGSEQAALISVSLGNKHILTLGAGAGDEEGIDENGNETPINENAKLSYIEILDSGYKTAGGVYVGMLLADAEKKYGKVKSIYLEPHSGEIGEFTNQPKGFNFIFTGKKSTPDGYSLAGVYGANGDGTTSKYIFGSYIHSISINNFEFGNENVKFSSSFSNFTTDCKLVDEEGAGRNECTTPDSKIFVSSNPVLSNISMGYDFMEAKTLFSQSFDSDFQKHKIEWRLADGEPYAVIFHLYEYGLHDGGRTAAKTGKEYYAVKGLGGYNFIDFGVSTSGNQYADETARQKADEMYRNGEEASLEYAVSKLVGATKVPLRIPTYLAPSENTKKFFTNFEPISEREFILNFDFTPGCGGSNACAWSSITGKKIDRGTQRLKGKAVKLDKNINGVFEEFECGASCSMSTLTWDENGYRYTLASKAAEIAEFIKMANSAINYEAPAMG